MECGSLGCANTREPLHEGRSQHRLNSGRGNVLGIDRSEALAGELRAQSRAKTTRENPSAALKQRVEPIHSLGQPDDWDRSHRVLWTQNGFACSKNAGFVACPKDDTTERLSQGPSPVALQAPVS